MHKELLILAVVAIIGFVACSADADLVAHWKFDEGEGTTASDSAGHNDGVVHGSEWIGGQLGTALRFNGLSDYVEVPNSPSQQITTNQMTVSAWIMLNADVGNTQARLICKQQHIGLSWGLEMIGAGRSGATGNQLVFHDSDGSTWRNFQSPTHLNPVRWYLVTVTDHAGVATFYLDGRKDYSSDGGFGVPSDIDAPIIMGKTYPSDSYFFNGAIDEVKIYDKALSAGEVEELFVAMPIYNVTQDTYHATIQAAVDDANEFDSIVVPVGTYTGPGNIDIDFKGKAITVRSKDPNDSAVVAATIIDCNASAEDRHRGFYFHSSEGSDSILEGLSIINGYAPNEPFYSDSYSAGGAVYCANSSPTIRKCVFANNHSDYWGGALWFGVSRSRVENCTFTENTSFDTGGGLYNRLGGIAVTNCFFSANSSDAGGAMYSIDSHPKVTVANSTFVGNSANIRGGAVRSKRANVTFTDCTFESNSATEDGGGMHNESGLYSLVRCLLSENTAGDSGGGLFNLWCTTTITNCTLTGSVSDSVAGMFIDEADTYATNSIFWDVDGGVADHDARGAVTYCNVLGGYPGAGNIDADPCFADAEGDDYHLKSEAGRWNPETGSWLVDDATSLCIDGSDPGSSISWEPYPNGGITNMGIYGGTAEASKSYFGVTPCQEPIAGDANGDCRVDFKDFMITALHWCEDNRP